MTKDGWAPDPLGTHEERWLSAGKPTTLVRDAWIESDDGPRRVSSAALVGGASARASAVQTSPPRRPDQLPPYRPQDWIPRREPLVNPPWGTLIRGDQPFAEGVAIWLLRTMMDFDGVLTVSDIHSSALRCGLFVDLLLAGMGDSNWQLAPDSPATGFALADDAVRDLRVQKSVEHWIRLGHPHGHEFADVLVERGDWHPLPHVVYHRYRVEGVTGRSVFPDLDDAFDYPEEHPVPVVALAALAGGLGYLGPKRRVDTPAVVVTAAGPAGEFISWAMHYLNARMMEIRVAGGVNAQANVLGGGV